MNHCNMVNQFSSMLIILWMILVLTVLEVVDVFSLCGFCLFESCFSISLDFLFIICFEFHYSYYWSIKFIRILKFSHLIYIQCIAFLNNIHNTRILSILVSENEKNWQSKYLKYTFDYGHWMIFHLYKSFYVDIELFSFSDLFPHLLLII